jgi:hypothetical protein
MLRSLCICLVGVILGATMMWLVSVKSVDLADWDWLLVPYFVVCAFIFAYGIFSAMSCIEERFSRKKEIFLQRSRRFFCRDNK